MNLSPQREERDTKDTEKENACISTFLPMATYYTLKYSWTVVMFWSEMIYSDSLYEERR